MQPVSLLPLREGTMDWRIEDHAWTGGGWTNKCLHLELAVPASGNLDTEIGCRAVLTLLVAHPRRTLLVFVKVDNLKELEVLSPWRKKVEVSLTSF